MYGSSPNLLQFVETLVEVLHRMVLSMRLGIPGDQVLEDFVGCGNTEMLPHLSPALNARHPLGPHDKASATVHHGRMEEEELMDFIRVCLQRRNSTYQQ
jgi:hypothetical protein